MEQFNARFENSTIELSEYKNYLTLRNRVCYYDYPNGNGVLLPYDESSLEKAQTLVDMPVVAKYCVNANGEPDLLDHCVSVDDDGNFVFGTMAVGVHTDVSIEDDEVQLFDGRIVTAKCLFATQKVWMRYPTYVAAIKRLFEENCLRNSWEISSSAYEYKDNIKTLREYVFDGNCLLGEVYTPAYGNTSKVLDLSAWRGSSELMIASALAQDLLESGLNKENSGKEDVNLGKEKEVNETTPVQSTEEQAPVEETIVEPAEGSDAADSASQKTDDEKVEPPDEGDDGGADGGEEEAQQDTDEATVTPETATLTDYDIRRKLNDACEKALDTWCWVSFVFPEEHVVWVEPSNRKSELEYKKFTYVVEGDEVTVSDPEDVRLTVSVASINQEIAQKSDALIEAMSKISELEAKVDELSTISEEYSAFVAQREKEQADAKRAELLEYVSGFNCFSEEDLASEEMVSKLDALDEVGLKCMVADKLASTLRRETPAVETATVRAELAMDEVKLDPVAEMRKFLNN